MALRPLAALFAVVLVAGALALGPGRPLLSHAAHAFGVRTQPTAVQPGSAFPALELANLDGTRATLDQHGTVIYNVFASWCPPCNAELPDMLRAHKDLAKRGVRFVGIDRGEPADRVSSFITERGINYPVVLDSTSSSTTLLGARVIPETIIVHNGTVAKIIVGPTTTSELEQAVQNV